MFKTRMILLVFNLFMSAILVAQENLFVHLELNNKVKLKVYHNEPVIISLSISNPGASEDEQWNRAANDWLAQLDSLHAHGEVSDSDYTEQKQQTLDSLREVDSVLIGSTQKPALQMVKFIWHDSQGNVLKNVPVRLLLNSASDDQFILDANGRYLLQWGIQPRDMRKLPPETYTLSISIGHYKSNKVKLTISQERIPVRNLQSPDMLMELGRFYLLYGRPEQAIIYARTSLLFNPRFINAYVLMGEANMQRNKNREALQNFQTALRLFNQQFPNSPEPPEFIQVMINELKSSN